MSVSNFLGKAKVSHILNWNTQHAAGVTTAEPYPHMFQGIPVNASVLEFIRALSKRCPTYKFAASEACSQNWSGRFTTEIFREVWVYRDGDEYAMGRIGYDNITARTSDKHMYTVRSRVINNERYSDTGMGYYTKGSQNLDKAVTTAIKYLRVFSPVEIAEISKESFANAYSKDIHAAGRMVQTYLQSARWDMSESLLTELTHLVQTAGYVPRNINVAKIVNEYIEAIKNHEEQSKRKLNAYFVRVHQEHGETMVTTVNYIDMHGSNKGKPREIVSVRANDIPHDIAGKVAVLDMVDIDQYIVGVGRRVSDTLYWLERDAQEVEQPTEVTA